MQNKSNVPVWGGILIAIVIAIVALTASKGSSAPPAGSSANGGNVTDYTAVNVTAGYYVNGSQVLKALSGITELILGSSAGTVTQIPSVPTCNSASSTLFAIAPPSSATSTVTLLASAFGGNATTSNLIIGTSTKSVGLAAADVSPALVYTTNGLSTSTVLWTASANTTGTGGFLAAGAANARILVKPGEFVVGFSTSTATTAYTPGMTVCTPKFLWTS